MRQFLLILLFIAVFSGGTYVARDWVQKQAYVIFSRQYVQEVADLAQTWNSQSAYPQGRQWLSDFYYQRRWELLVNWGKALMDFNRNLHLQGEFIQTIEKFAEGKADFREADKMKFYVLELKDRANRLPKTELRRTNSIFNLVVPQLVVLRALVWENKQMVRRVASRLPQLNSMFQAQQEPDTNSYCLLTKAMHDRQTIVMQMKEKCADTSNAPLPMCQQGAVYFQSEIERLQKLDQLNIDNFKQRWPQWREPACAQ